MKESLCITNQNISLKGKTVLVRAGLNVPIKDGKIESTFRIDKVLRTIDYLVSRETKVVIVGHIGRDTSETLKPVFEYIQEKNSSAIFYENFFSDMGSPSFDVEDAQLRKKIDESANGSLHILDNVRQTELEKSNSNDLSEYLASIADIYVHEAFPVAHRKHASVYGSPLLFHGKHKFFGITFWEEMEHLSKMEKPKSPSLFVLGGAKFETKLPMLQKYSNIYDYTLVGGALLNNVLDEMGHEVGTSLKDDLEIDMKNKICAFAESPGSLIPDVVTCETKDGDRIDKKVTDIEPTDKILDVSPETLDKWEDTIVSCETILWNGPLGYFEGGYIQGSQRLIELISKSNSHSVVGGGDTISAIYQSGKEESFDFLSTGGGSTIEFLSSGTLPGIQAITE